METELYNVMSQTGKSGFTTEIRAGGHVLFADEPLSAGGGNKGPNPYDLLLSALGSCTGMTVLMYAKHRNIRLDNIKVYLRHDKEYLKDCEHCNDEHSKIDVVYRHIALEGDISTEEKARLLEIANKCPVHKTLTHGFDIRTTLV